MCKKKTKTVAGAICSAMGRETISKSRVSPKNVKSRGKFYIIHLLLAATIIFVGCKKDDPNNPNVSVPDPEGTITANLSGSTYVRFENMYNLSDNNNGWDLGWISPDNFHFGSRASIITAGTIYDVQISVCDLGKMKGLGNIQSIPSNGFSNPSTENKSISCETGHGYVFKVEDLTGNNNPTGMFYYVRLYVVESIVSTSGGIMGAKVKYQYPFEPTN